MVKCLVATYGFEAYGKSLFTEHQDSGSAEGPVFYILMYNQTPNLASWKKSELQAEIRPVQPSKVHIVYFM